MPTLDVLDYENFTYDEPNARPLALDEAVRKAKELRNADPSNLYRIKKVDVAGTEFRVEAVPLATLYANFLTRFTQRFARITKLAQR